MSDTYRERAQLLREMADEYEQMADDLDSDFEQEVARLEQDYSPITEEPLDKLKVETIPSVRLETRAEDRQYERADYTVVMRPAQLADPHIRAHAQRQIDEYLEREKIVDVEYRDRKQRLRPGDENNWNFLQ